MSSLYLLLSSPRSGSNFLSSILREHPNIDVLVEPLNQYVTIIRDSELEYWNYCAVDEERGIKMLAENSFDSRYLRYLRRWLALKCGVTILKETKLATKLAWFQRLLPDARYLFLFRRPDEVVASFLNGNFFDRWKYKEKFQNLRSSSHLVLDSVAASNSEIVAHIWDLRAREMLAFSEENYGRVAFVDYNRLVEEPGAYVEKLLHHLGLEMVAEVHCEIAEKTRTTKGGVFSTYRSKSERPITRLSPEDAQRVSAICGANYDAFVKRAL